MKQTHIKSIAIVLGFTLVFYAILLIIVPNAFNSPEAFRMEFLVRLIFLFLSALVMGAILYFLLFKRSYYQGQITTFRKFKNYLLLMVKRDFIAKYRRSVLGVLWTILNPLLTMIVMTIVFSHLFRFEIPFFPVYLLSGQILFNFFNEGTTSAMGSIVNASGVIKKVYIPKYIFPLSKVMSSLINIIFSFIAFIGVVIFTGAPIHWTLLLTIIPVLYLFAFALGIGMILSSISVFFRDMNYLYGVFITMLSFLTPLFYPVEILPANVYFFIQFNPMYHYVSFFRSLAIDGTFPDIWANMICIGFAIAAITIGTFVTLKQQDKYILYV